MQKQAELYRGKAKTVYSTENPDLLVLEFRNDTSAGDGARIEQFDRKVSRRKRRCPWLKSIPSKNVRAARLTWQ